MAITKLSEIVNGFGVVTVFNAKCVSIAALNDTLTDQDWAGFCKENTAVNIAKKIVNVYEAEKAKAGSKEWCLIDSLKIANLNVEGPSKTITGGQYANPLIKFGKTATCEMQDALGRMDALSLLAGMEIDDSSYIHVTSKFGKPVAIIGETFVIDRVTSDQVPVWEVIYQFLPDSIVSLSQQSDGDAAVFDLNGSLMATDIKSKDGTYRGAFYSIIDEQDMTPPTPVVSYTLTVDAGSGEYTGEDITTDEGGNFTAPAATTIDPAEGMQLVGFLLNNAGEVILPGGAGVATGNGTLNAQYETI